MIAGTLKPQCARVSGPDIPISVTCRQRAAISSRVEDGLGLGTCCTSHVRAREQEVRDIRAIGVQPSGTRAYGVNFTSEEVDLIHIGSATGPLGINGYPKQETPHTFGWKRRSPSPYKG